MSYSSALDALLSAAPSGSYLDIFSSFSLAADTSVYNANLWGGGGATINFTGICHRTNPASSFYCRMVAVTKRHLVTSYHTAAAPTVGAEYTWIATNGVRVTRTVSAIQTIASISGTTGFQLAYLSADLPVSISPVAILGGELPPGTPVIKTNQFHQATIADISSYAPPFVSFVNPTNPTRSTYYSDWIGNDSGSPAFVYDGTRLVFVTGAVFGYAGAGPSAALYVSDLVAACAAIDADNTGYAPLVCDQHAHARLSIGSGI